MVVRRGVVPRRKPPECWDQKTGRDARWEHLFSPLLVRRSQIGRLCLPPSLGLPPRGALLAHGLLAVALGLSTSDLRILAPILPPWEAFLDYSSSPCGCHYNTGAHMCEELCPVNTFQAPQPPRNLVGKVFLRCLFIVSMRK